MPIQGRSLIHNKELQFAMYLHSNYWLPSITGHLNHLSNIRTTFSNNPPMQWRMSSKIVYDFTIYFKSSSVQVHLRSTASFQFRLVIYIHHPSLQLRVCSIDSRLEHCATLDKMNPQAKHNHWPSVELYKSSLKDEFKLQKNISKGLPNVCSQSLNSRPIQMQYILD